MKFDTVRLAYFSSSTRSSLCLNWGNWSMSNPVTPTQNKIALRWIEEVVQFVKRLNCTIDNENTLSNNKIAIYMICLLLCWASKIKSTDIRLCYKVNSFISLSYILTNSAAWILLTESPLRSLGPVIGIGMISKELPIYWTHEIHEYPLNVTANGYSAKIFRKI